MPQSLPNALGAWREIEGRLRGKRVALFLDYDGTLTPIVRRPELAVLSAEMRSALEAVGPACPTAIVSGRALEDVTRRVALPQLVYAGSHGFDIAGPDGLRLEVARESIAALRDAAAELRRRTAGIPGVIVEEKRFSVALHDRQVAPAARARVEASFRAVLEGSSDLRPSEGKRVLELRPAVEWDKGSAVVWILQARGLAGPDVLPIYIGDDVTDQDAFRALAGRGVAIQVASVPWSADAEYTLADVAEVRHFLLRLAAVAAEEPARPA